MKKLNAIHFQMLSFSVFKQMSRPSYSVPHYSIPHYSIPHYSIPHYSIPRVPPGLTADAIVDAIYVAYGTEVNVRLVPANPIFRYGGVQHAAIITMKKKEEESTVVDDSRVVYDLKVVYDLEAQLHFTIQKINGPNEDLEKEKEKEKEKERMWRWALRGIVIQ